MFKLYRLLLGQGEVPSTEDFIACLVELVRAGGDAALHALGRAETTQLSHQYSYMGIVPSSTYTLHIHGPGHDM